MKRLGYLLIALGFLGGALASVIRESGVPWPHFALGLGVGVAGLVLVRLGERQRIQTQREAAGSLEDLIATLERITANSRQLDAEKAHLDPRTLHTRIDATFRRDLAHFMANRERIIHACGLQAYADVMSPLATGERYLNRVWSASTDGYVDEAWTYLERAAAQFAEAYAHLTRLASSDQRSAVSGQRSGLNADDGRLMADG